jgi:hypothetical protein
MNEHTIQSIINAINLNPIKPVSIGTIYSISANGDLYIGKTSTSLSIRSNGHKQSFEKYKKNQSKRWCKSTYVMEKNERCIMNILDIYPIYNDDDKEQLLEQEQIFISAHDCVNKNCEDNDEQTEEYVEDDDDVDAEQTNKISNCIIDIPIEFGCIYKIYDTEGVYVGSTKGPISYRMNGHIRSALIYGTSKSMRICSSHEIILRNNYNTEIIEWVVIMSKNDLLTRERVWIENIDCVNKIIPIRSIEESKEYHNRYYETHKNDPDFIATNNKYKLDNKERIALNHQRWREENKEKQRIYFNERHQTQKLNPVYVEKRKEHKRKYNQSERGKLANNEYNHRPEVKEHRNEMYLLKKESETEEERHHRKQAQKERKSQIVECCGTKMTRNSLTSHKKTKKHIENNRIKPSVDMY